MNTRTAGALEPGDSIVACFNDPTHKGWYGMLVMNTFDPPVSEQHIVIDMMFPDTQRIALLVPRDREYELLLPDPDPDDPSAEDDEPQGVDASC